MSPFEVHFGGPDRPRGYLRDVLAARIEAVPAGGSIDWVTYYFRDRRLARDLVRAHERGVRVRVTLDGQPRSKSANAAVCEILRRGLGAGLRVAKRPSIPSVKRWLPPRIHEKLYCFSHPTPVAIIGSFNPSGDEPEEQPQIVREIGDQDRAHNVLVSLQSPRLVQGLVEHARELHSRRHSFIDRFRPSANRLLSEAGTTIFFLPRSAKNPAIELLRRCGAGHRVRIAASHLSGPTSLRTFRNLAERGAKVEVLAGATERRVPQATERRLHGAGIEIRRAAVPDGIPMHAKFALISGHDERWTIFGSFNWSERSRRMNREIGAVSSDPELFDAFTKGWESLRTADSAAGRQPHEDGSTGSIAATSTA